MNVMTLEAQVPTPAQAAFRPGRGPSQPLDSLGRTLVMDRLIDLLIEKAKAGLHWPDVYEHARQTVRTVGLTCRGTLAAEYRLRNAAQYATDGEFGAAAFELRLVRT